jgi:hypothetical protein
MDESVERFKAEQKRLEGAGGPSAAVRQALMSYVTTMVVFSLAAYGTMSFMNLFPRNSDNSVQFAIFAPTTATLAIISTLILRFFSPRAQAIRWTCWAFIALAVIGIPAGFFDYLTKSGS